MPNYRVTTRDADGTEGVGYMIGCSSARRCRRLLEGAGDHILTCRIEWISVLAEPLNYAWDVALWLLPGLAAAGVIWYILRLVAEVR
jgi:hypothetical protein